MVQTPDGPFNRHYRDHLVMEGFVQSIHAYEPDLKEGF
jgi:hypothetical protein